MAHRITPTPQTAKWHEDKPDQPRSNDMPKKAESSKNDNRVWIELERPTSPKQGQQRAALLTNMLRTLGMPTQRVWWSEHEGRYCYGDTMGYIVLSDDGHWFSLDYFGRTPEEAAGPEYAAMQADLSEQAADFRTLQEKMVSCGWGDLPDGTVKHEHLGREQSSWVDAISACIEVASEA